jgi:hypothetical protein
VVLGSLGVVFNGPSNGFAPFCVRCARFSLIFVNFGGMSRVISFSFSEEDMTTTVAGCPQRFRARNNTRRQLLQDVPSDFVLGITQEDNYCRMSQAISFSEADMTTTVAGCPKRFRSRKQTIVGLVLFAVLMH